MKKFIKDNAFFFIACCVFLPLFIINQIPPAARALSFLNEWYTLIAGSIISLLPFSLLSALVLLLPVILAVLIIIFIKSKGKGKFALSLTGVIMVMLSLFILSMGLGYSRESVYNSLNLNLSNPSDQIIEEALDYYISKLNESASLVELSEDNNLSPDFTFKELTEILRQEYAKHDFDFMYSYTPKVKAFFLSDFLNYLGIAGIYAGPVGEANVSANLPWKDLIFTSAHELAHSKGVLNEGEANFVAFLICSNAENVYLRYAGYSYAVTNILNYAFLFTTDKAGYTAKVATINEKARFVYETSEDFYVSYDGTLSDISSKINDAYIKGQGMPQGIKTYSLASKGIIGYYIKYHD